MIEHLIDLAKLVVGVAIGTFIGSYIMEWRIRRILKKELPRIVEVASRKVKMTPEQQREIVERIEKNLSGQSCQETP